MFRYEMPLNLKWPDRMLSSAVLNWPRNWIDFARIRLQMTLYFVARFDFFTVYFISNVFQKFTNCDDVVLGQNNNTGDELNSILDAYETEMIEKTKLLKQQTVWFFQI
jgi:hypothetical protein